MSISPQSPTSVLETKGASFFWASFFLGKRYMLRAARLYRLCRYLDDTVDECESPEQGRRMILDVTQNLSSSSSKDEVINDGLALLQECGINKTVLLELINGVNSDNDLVRLQDQKGLLHYCYQVAGTVGLMMCRVLDAKNPKSKPFAKDLGIAMQLTNICRDIKADALVNRRYLPADLIHNLEPSALIKPNARDIPIIKSAVQLLLKLADVYYKRGERGLAYLPLRARFSILIASRIYREIGVKLASQQYEYWPTRIVVSNPRKFVVTLGALISVFYRYNFWIPPNSYTHPKRTLEDAIPLNSSLSLMDIPSDIH